MPASAVWRGAAAPVLFLIAAEVIMKHLPYQSESFAAPSSAAAAFVEMARDGTLLNLTAQTLATCLAGSCIGMAIGLFFGTWMGLSRITNGALSLTVEMLRPVPAIALLPILMMIFGLGYRMEIALVAFTCVWPMLVLSRAAIAGIEPQLLEVARLLELPSAVYTKKIVLPAVLPRIFVAVRLTIGIGLIVAVTSEITANPLGLGHAIMMSQQTFRPDAMFALLGWIAVIGWAVSYGLMKFEHKMFVAWG